MESSILSGSVSGPTGTKKQDETLQTAPKELLDSVKNQKFTQAPFHTHTQRGSVSSIGPPSLSHSPTNTPSVGEESPFPDKIGSTAATGRWTKSQSDTPLINAHISHDINKPLSTVDRKNNSPQLPQILRPPALTLDKKSIIKSAHISPQHPDIDIISSQAQQILLRAKHQLTVSIAII